jgi:hypothetical protein
MQAPLPEGRYAMGMTGIADTIYLIGGKIGSSQTGSGSAPALVLQADAWQAIEQPPEGGQQSDLELVALGDHLYLLGGTVDGALSPQILAYQAVYIVLLPVQNK